MMVAGNISKEPGVFWILFEIDNSEYEQKILQIEKYFSVNDYITIANILCIDNSESIDELSIRIFLLCVLLVY